MRWRGAALVSNGHVAIGGKRPGAAVAAVQWCQQCRHQPWLRIGVQDPWAAWHHIL